VLNASSLVTECYENMFRNCSSLINAPNSNVYTIKSPAQSEMFTGAINIENPMLWCKIPANFGGGGNSNCPYITINNATRVIPRWTVGGDPLQYKIGTGVWTSATSGTGISVTGGTEIKFRGSGRNTLFSGTNTNWDITGTNVVIGGNMNALLDYQNPPSTIGDYAFCYMFADQTSITQFNALLPTTILSYYCYYYMFSGCTSLVTGPTLPATTLNNSCYNGMFRNCTNLVNAPNLPATQLVANCYSMMFLGCTKLTTAPGSNVYTTYYTQAAMFRNCTALTTPLTYAQIPADWK
jgi:hypothetical protein